MILIVSTPTDNHATAVMGELDAMGTPHAMLNLAEFPRAIAFSWELESNGSVTRCTFSSGGAPIELHKTTSVWWRRPQPLELHPEMGDPVNQRFAYRECHEALAGAWLTTDTFWMNDPAADEKACSKLYQLRTANACGLRVPETCVTSKPDTVRALFERQRSNIVYKAFSACEEAWRETRKITSDELDMIDNVRFAPVIFQEFIPAVADLRITIVGDRMFAADIRTPSNKYAFDYRMSMDSAEFHAVDLPTSVESVLHDLMERLGIIYGAVDMRLTPDGEYVFLEVNPSGQWDFVEERTGQPIARAVAERLAKGVAQVS